MLKKYDKVLYEALIQEARISKDTLRPIAREVERSGESLQQVLVKKGLLLEKDILNILAEKLGVECINLHGLSVEKSVLAKVPEKIASYYKFLPIRVKGRVLTIAVSSPLDIKTQDEIRTQLGYDIDLVFSCQKDILTSIEKHYGVVDDTVEKIVSQQTLGAGTEYQQGLSPQKVEDIEKLAEDASVIKLVNQIILEGWKKRATDIHIEPHRDRVFIRYRIDGVLYDTNVSPAIRNFLNAIISRIKIISNLNIVERRLPQDGRAIVSVQEQMLDLRISTIPTPFGESVVIRILPTQMLFSLERLGLAKNNLQIFEKLIHKPHGIIFVTGPTGSGKTTTLYACLNRINTKERKIITIEDPIEYEMPKITQMQVMPEIGLNFARGLRSILRHDPDVIMLGEVRDLETAEIAIRVALTGHLIFSTLHTNDAASGIARLIDIGVEPYLVASSVEAFIAQRLIRLICPECKYEDKAAPKKIKETIARELESQPDAKSSVAKKAEGIKIFRGKGCSNCNFTGFFGRTAIYEFLLPDERIKDLILKKAPSNRIREVAISRGMKILRQDGWQKVVSGLTIPEEVMQASPTEENVVIEKKTKVSLRPEPPGEALPKVFESDRRIYTRVNKRINLRYKAFKSREELLKGESVAEELAATKDISAGGLLFVSENPLPITSILELKIELLDGEDPIECLARVVRIDENEPDKTYSVAVCFLDIASAQRVRLDKYVKEKKE